MCCARCVGFVGCIAMGLISHAAIHYWPLPSCAPQLVARDSFFHFFGEGAAAGAGVRAGAGEEGEKGAAVMDEDAQVDAVTVAMTTAAA